MEVASRHDRSWDSSGCPNALSCASASVATNSPRRRGASQMGSPPDYRPRRPSTIVSRRATAQRRNRRAQLREGHRGTIARLGHGPIRVGVIADQTGPLSFVGLANANVARMVVGDLNAKGGLLGRPARAPSRGRRDRRRRRRRSGRQAGRAARRPRRLRRHLQLHAAGDQGAGRGAGQDALRLPGAVRGSGVGSAHLLHRPRAGAAGRPADPLADARDRRADVLPPVRRLHLAARPEPARPGQSSRPNGGSIVGEEYHPLDHTTTRRPSSGSWRAAPTSCSTRSCRPG